MRHGRAYRKFGREAAPRRAMIRSLTTSLFQHERVETTVAKAKDLRRVAEKMITLAANDTVANRRRALEFVYSKPVVHKLFTEIGPKFKERPGGYTRVLRSRRRVGDAAELAVIELVQEEFSPKKKSTKKAKKSAPKKAEQAKEAASEEAAEAPQEEAQVAAAEETVTEEASAEEQQAAEAPAEESAPNTEEEKSEEEEKK